MGALKNTPLLDEHLALDAKMVPFAGWNMPVQYPGGILAEHKHTRTRCSIFDISHMGEFRVAGAGAAAALDRALARATSDLKIGSCRYNFLLNEAGGVLDDLIVYRMDEEDFFIVVNAGNIASDFAAFTARMPETLELRDLSDDLAKFDLQGPEAAAVLAKLGLDPVKLPGYYRHTMAEVGGVRCILSRTGYTGELGFELYFRAEAAPELWKLFLATSPVAPAGLGARDTLRLEMCYALYGHELDDKRTPFDCGQGALVKLDDGRDFVGKSALLAGKPARQLRPVKLDSRRAARAGARVFASDGREVGRVTSGAFCPTLGAAAALCDLDAAFPCPEGTLLELETGSVTTPGKVVSAPFVAETSLRAKVQ